jgi:hydrogenase/urease accessory protein HupE
MSAVRILVSVYRDSIHLFRCLLLISLSLFPSALKAHQPSNSSLAITIQEEGVISGEYHVADVDIESINFMIEDRLIHSDSGGHPIVFDPLTQGAYALPFIRVSLDGQALTLNIKKALRVMTDGNLHSMIPFTVDTAIGEELVVTFESFFDFDPQHRVTVSLNKDQETKLVLLTLDDPSWIVSLKKPGVWQQFLQFTWEGVWHIWIGLDHILFLVALLLPSVLRSQNKKWCPVSNFKDATYNVLKVVTAFTIAHSITLTLAALDIVTLPAMFVESVIALSVVLVALNNIFPVISDRVWTVAFGFGLIHGFGFANVLANLQLPTGTLAIALFSFNVGVELGQIAIVSIFFPLIYAIRERNFYPPVILKTGSAIITLIASAWIIDRVFDLELMPF